MEVWEESFQAWLKSRDPATGKEAQTLMRVAGFQLDPENWQSAKAIALAYKEIELELRS